MGIFLRYKITFLLAFVCCAWQLRAQVREHIPLNESWFSTADDSLTESNQNFFLPAFQAKGWKKVNIPHNWDTYHGLRRMRHGNRHGYAWYRRDFTAPDAGPGRRYFIFFEGVGSYARVYVNGQPAGEHAGGRTTFTLDITDLVHPGKENLLAVRADHPPFIRDLPWVCGGCSDEIGFSEGSQPMGIFRPVTLVITRETRIEPFGIHAWADVNKNGEEAVVHADTELRHYGKEKKEIKVLNRLVDPNGKTVGETENRTEVLPGKKLELSASFNPINHPLLWDISAPERYLLQTEIWEGNEMLDSVHTLFGIRYMQWPDPETGGPFLLNGKPVFINGTAEYEHAMGGSHAFSKKEINSRTRQVMAAGYNAFRDAHQPHNLRYQEAWDANGILWWPQFAAHIWFDTPEFRNNFKNLLRDWVKERRNSPSIILWGLENESTLPEDFAKECVAIIREMVPGASVQQPVTTCNGGSGTDWDVPQNWTGTYGGDPATYGTDLIRQVLVGEYGAWRTAGLHAEKKQIEKNAHPEEEMTGIMETKIRLADSVKNQVAGHFHWLLYSHENPGRSQSGEGFREIDRVGPVNYKGLFTLWGQPTDAFYLFRSNFIAPETEPMVHIVSHTWPGRWVEPGIKSGISVYSNCEEVELFNDMNGASLGRHKTRGRGRHFEWNQMQVKYNTLRAVGYQNNKAVCEDVILLHHLPQAPGLKKFYTQQKDLLQPTAGRNYHYRVNCGGDDFTDRRGNTWRADVPASKDSMFGSKSWADQFKGIPSVFGSSGNLFIPIKGTREDEIFHSYRYGREELQFRFPLPNGWYEVELFFTEPWYAEITAEGYRIFDVAINDSVVLDDFDIWKEAGYAGAVKKTVIVAVKNGMLDVSFPEVLAGQAIVSAIAISSFSSPQKKQVPERELIAFSSSPKNKIHLRHWMNTGARAFSDTSVRFTELPPQLYGADWIQSSFLSPATVGADVSSLLAMADADVFVGIQKGIGLKPGEQFLPVPGNIRLTGDRIYDVFRKRVRKGEIVRLPTSPGSYLILAANEPSDMETAFDLKPVTGININNALLFGEGLVKDTVNGKNCVRFTKHAGDSIVWKLNPGVADLYSIRLRYVNKTDQPYFAKLVLRAADGTVMKEEQVRFEPYLPHKWGLLHTDTGSFINAGNYTLTLVGIRAEGLCVAGLEVQ